MASSGKTISVDVGALRLLAGRLNVAKQSLVSDTGMFSGGSNGIEHPVLRRSIDKFEENWSDRRHEIESGLGTTADALRKVSDSFEEVDQKLAQELSKTGAEPKGDVR